MTVITNEVELSFSLPDLTKLFFRALKPASETGRANQQISGGRRRLLVLTKLAQIALWLEFEEGHGKQYPVILSHKHYYYHDCYR